MSTSFQVTFDCADPDGLATFWAEALGYVKQPPPDGYETWPEFLRTIGFPEELMDARSAIVDPEGGRPRFFFQKVPEGKAAKNRVHLDLNVSAGAEDGRARTDEEAERLVDLGATKARAVEEQGQYWIVMQDPEGNEFCLQ